MSDDFEIVSSGKRRHRYSRLVLIPKGDGRDIIPKREIAPSLAPAQRLNGNLQIPLEIDRVGYMPTVHGKPHLRAVKPIRTDHGKAGIGGGKVAVSVVVKIIRPAEIIFRSGAAYRGIFTVSVDVEFDFPFSPPAAAV